MLVNRGISGIVYNRLITAAPASPTPAADSHTRRIRTFMGDCSRKASAPEGFGPAGTWADRNGVQTAYEVIRTNLAQFADRTAAPLRYSTVRHPAFGPRNGNQWLVMLAAHPDRNLQQIGEVKQSAGYPDSN